MELKWKKKSPKKKRFMKFLGATLEEILRSELVAILKRNIDCFAWSHSNMGGIYPKMITHQLNVDPLFLPIK